MRVSGRPCIGINGACSLWHFYLSLAANLTSTFLASVVSTYTNFARPFATSRMLFLDNNAITAVAVGAFNDMAVLSVLSLAYNSIARFPDGMVRLHELQILDLSSNQIRVLPRRSLPSYSNKLRWLVRRPQKSLPL